MSFTTFILIALPVVPVAAYLIGVLAVEWVIRGELAHLRGYVKFDPFTGITLDGPRGPLRPHEWLTWQARGSYDPDCLYDPELLLKKHGLDPFSLRLIRVASLPFITWHGMEKLGWLRMWRAVRLNRILMSLVGERE